MTLGLWIAALLWIVALACVPAAVIRRNALPVFCAGTMAATVTLQIDGVYHFVDPLLGGANFVNLGDRALAIVCLVGWHIAIQSALTGSPPSRKVFLGSAAVGGVLIVAQTFVFLGQAWPGSDPRLDRWAGSIRLSWYAAILWVAMAWIAGSALFVAVRGMGRPMNRKSRSAAVLISAGSVMALGWSALLLAQEIRFATTSDSAPLFGPVNNLILVAALLIVTGLAIAPAAHGLAEAAAWVHWVSLRPLWRELTEAVPTVRVPDAARSRPSHRLHRRTVEVRDAALVLGRDLDHSWERRLRRWTGELP